MGLFAERLLATLEREAAWPPPSQRSPWARVEDWIAYRESDRERLRTLAGWTNRTKRYYVDPLPELINSAFSSLLFGDVPQFEPFNEGDAGLLEPLIMENQLPWELQRSVLKSSSEGEVWWRWVSNVDVADGPILSWHSRTEVIPFWSNGKIVAAAYFTELENPTPQNAAVWRLLEVHDRDEVTNAVYVGTETTLGMRKAPDAHPELEGVREVWHHGLPMLMGRIINRLGANQGMGRSDFDGIEDFLLELNEAASIGAKNMRTTAIKRVVVTESALDKSTGMLDQDQEVIVAETLAETMTEATGKGPYQVLEYSFDAEALISWQNNLATQALTRVGITPQFVGMPTGAEGFAQSGTALRIRLLPSDNAAQDRAQWYDRAIPYVLRLGQMLDSLPTDDLGFGRAWSAPHELPSMQRGEPIREDVAEMADRHVGLKGAGLMSLQQSLEERYPDWSEEQIQEEIQRIRDDAAADSAAAFSTGF